VQIRQRILARATLPPQLRRARLRVELSDIWTYYFAVMKRVPIPAVVIPLFFLVGCASSCDHHDEESAPVKSAAKVSPAAPTIFAPRSHELIESGNIRITPLRAIEVTPRAQAQGQQPGALSVSASGDPDSGGVPLTVNFTADVQGGSSDLRYRWDFGDNSPPATQLTTQHTYRSPGDFTATLTVTGPDAEDSDDVSIQVSEEGFDVSIDADPDVGKPPLTVHFSAVLDDEDQPGPFYYQWDFGDGGHDVANPTTHTYREPGEYTTTCVVTNVQGQVGHEEVEIQVDASEEDQGTQ
jgi:PKD repeat protein